MALTTVVTDRFLSRVTGALRDMQEDARIGEFSLVMLIPSKIYSNSWSLVVAAQGLDRLGLREATGLVLQLKNALLGDEAKKIDTVSVLRTDEPAVRELATTFQIEQLGTVYQAHDLSAYLNLEEPLVFIAKAA